jgi:selenocysteine-specific elongation factor
MKDILNTFPREGEGRIKNVFNYLTKGETFVEILAGTYLHRTVLEQAKEALLDYLKARGAIRAAEYKDVLGVSRNVARDLLDYFFDHKVTVRVKGTHQLPGTGS